MKGVPPPPGEGNAILGANGLEKFENPWINLSINLSINQTIICLRGRKKMIKL